MVQVKQQGPLGDLREIPWGTADADELNRLLDGSIARRDLDKAAATGALRARINEFLRTASPQTFRDLLALLDRPLAVRHALRGGLDWSDPTVWDVHRALVEVFGDGEGPANASRLVGIDTAEIDLDDPAEAVWTALMNAAARQHRLEALVDAALSDAAIGAHGSALESARDRPWRIDTTPAPLPEPESTPLAEPEPQETPSSDPWPHIRKERSHRPHKRALQPNLHVFALGLVSVLALALFFTALVLLFFRSGGEGVPVVGALWVSGVRGQLVLTQAGEVVQRVDAEKTFAFTHPIATDADGNIDETWGVRFERSDLPCPALPMPLDHSAPDRQRFSIAAARADLVDGVCRVTLWGMDELVEGAIVSLDADTVSPARFAKILAVDEQRADAVALGPWDGCHACWPAPASCADALAALVAHPADDVRWKDALIALEGAVGCSEEDEAKRSELLASLPQPEPKPKPKPKPRPITKRKRR